MSAYVQVLVAEVSYRLFSGGQANNVVSNGAAEVHESMWWAPRWNSVHCADNIPTSKLGGQAQIVYDFPDVASKYDCFPGMVTVMPAKPR